ncbi:FISUMP domain-containing protein [Flavobacterium sp. ZS1P14]|uniref:FISUMP domain-containing protein n=1 Tax=Flavobacterium sp. ZS1P14 TaxID=3401729 RepID=UPI003AB06357
MKIAKFFLFAIMAITILSCSNEGVNPAVSENILGKWKTSKVTNSNGENLQLQSCGYKNTSTFSNDGIVAVFDNCVNKTISSKYTLNGNILTITTVDKTDNTTLTEKFTVLEINDTTLRIQITWDSDYGNYPQNERDIIEFIKDGSNSINKNIINTTVSSITSTTAKYQFSIISDDNLTARGVCWSTSQTPVSTGNHTSNLSGLLLTGNITGLTPNTKYYLRAYNTKTSGTEYGDQISFTTNPIFLKGNGLTDICGNSYSTIVLNGKEWVQKNLDVCKYRNGDPIPQVQDMTQWNKLTTGAWCYYENKTENGIVYSKLYNGYAVNDPRGLAPDGWHISSASDLDSLITYLGGLNLVAGKMKEKGTTHWASPNTGATNESGFTGLPGGVVALSGAYPNIVTVYSGIGYSGGWWNTSEKGSYYGYWLTNNSSTLSSGSADPNSALSIRCVKD